MAATAMRVTVSTGAHHRPSLSLLAPEAPPPPAVAGTVVVVAGVPGAAPATVVLVAAAGRVVAVAGSLRDACCSGTPV